MQLLEFRLMLGIELGIILTYTGIWLGRLTRRCLGKKAVRSKELHEIFPEILEWKIGDEVTLNQSCACKGCAFNNHNYNYKYKSVTDSSSIIFEEQPSFSSFDNALVEYEVFLFQGNGEPRLRSKDSETYIGTTFKNNPAKQRRLALLVENSEYNKFLQAHWRNIINSSGSAEATKQITRNGQR